MKHIFTRAVMPLLAAALAVAGCKKDDPTAPDPNPNPQELITTVILQLTDTTGNAANTINAVFRDIDGPGGTPPTIDTLRLKSGVGYNCHILLLDQTKTPVDTISHEVEEEGKSHRLWHFVAGSASGRITIVNMDDDGGTPTPLPVGLHIRVNVTAGGATTGTFRTLLKHYVPESLKRSDTNGTLGNTDVDVTFPLTIAP